MRKLSEIIVLVRGAGEVGSAVAHRLYLSHFRVCLTDIASPLAINRGASFSEAIFETTKTVDGVTAERSLPDLEHIYKVWRNGNIPIVSDPELAVKPLLLPDVLVNAMMLKRKTNISQEDAPLVLGIGPGFEAGGDVHLVIQSGAGCNLGKVLMQGAAIDADASAGEENTVYAADAGVFTTGRNIGDAVAGGDEIGRLDEVPVKAPAPGILRGISRDQVKVLANTPLAVIDAKMDKNACFSIRDETRAIAGGVLEAIMMSFNQ